MFDIKDITIGLIDRQDAKRLCLINHYMATYPAGAILNFGIFCDKRLLGVAVFGKSTSTLSKCRLFGIKNNEIIEMQRLWISDLLGRNAESKTLSKLVAFLHSNYPILKVIWTYSGGCKNDCGIVYQSSGFMYLGAEPCNDFYLTEKGQYKNIVNILRFGKGNKDLDITSRVKQLYGNGEFIKSYRYKYFYPLCKGVRRKMSKSTLPFPKTSVRFRKDQKWIEGCTQGELSS